MTAICNYKKHKYKSYREIWFFTDPDVLHAVNLTETLLLIGRKKPGLLLISIVVQVRAV